MYSARCPRKGARAKAQFNEASLCLKDDEDINVADCA
jgi:hypothetical protein